MARSHGKQTRVLVNAAHLSGSIDGWRWQHRRLLSDVSVLTSNGEQFLPGQLGGSLAIRGVFDSAVGDIVATLQTAATTDGGLLTTMFPETPAVGSLASFGEGNVSERDYPAAVKDAVRVTLEGTPNDGVDMGVTLHVLGAETADGNSTNVDNGASTAGGAVGVVHVTAYTGFTSVSLRVQHSPDNSAWSDLITFTAVTGTTWQRSAVTGTVNRHLRAFWDVTGSGSLTFAMVCARR